MGCRLYLVNVMNFFALLLGVGLLILGVRTQLDGLTGLALVILVIAFLGCCGACTESSYMLIMYSISMVLLALLCVVFLVDPKSVKPPVAKRLEEFILAAYMNSGSVDDLMCCPMFPLKKPIDVKTWANEIIYVGNKVVCVGAGVMGLPSCEDVILCVSQSDFHKIFSAGVAADRAIQIRRK